MSVFTTKGVKTSQFDAIPAGDYPCTINRAHIGPTKNGAGQALFLSMNITGEHYTGRLLFDELLRVHHSQQAVGIASSRLAQICQANNVTDLENWEDLVGMQVIARIKQVQDPGYNPRNQVTRYLSATPVTADDEMPF